MKTYSIIETSAERARRDKIQKWLSPSDPSTNHNKALEERHDGTGQWFTRGRIFESFKQGGVPFLWLHGIPGCGKTILSASIIEDLDQRPSIGTPVLLYFYFDFNDNRKQRLEDVLRTLLWQTLRYPGDFLREMVQLYASCQEGGVQPSVKALLQTLDQVLQMMDDVRIVLDAVDECTTRSALLPWLDSLVKQESGSIRILVTSRKEHDIEIEFERWLAKDAIVPLRQLEVDRDISAYVLARLRNDRQLQRWQKKPKIQEEIETLLMEKANGMCVSSSAAILL